MHTSFLYDLCQQTIRELLTFSGLVHTVKSLSIMLHAARQLKNILLLEDIITYMKTHNFPFDAAHYDSIINTYRDCNDISSAMKYVTEVDQQKYLQQRSNLPETIQIVKSLSSPSQIIHQQYIQQQSILNQNIKVLHQYKAADQSKCIMVYSNICT